MGSDFKFQKLLIGYCLQSLEQSRHRLYASSSAGAGDDGDAGITDREQSWLLSLETCIVDYVSSCDGNVVQDAVATYVSVLSSTTTQQFYAAEYPLVLLELLCLLITKTDRLKAVHGRQLVHICVDVLLNIGACMDKLTQPGL